VDDTRIDASDEHPSDYARLEDASDELPVSIHWNHKQQAKTPALFPFSFPCTCGPAPKSLVINWFCNRWRGESDQYCKNMHRNTGTLAKSGDLRLWNPSIWLNCRYFSYY